MRNIKCPECKRRLFDITGKWIGETLITIKCQACKKIVEINLTPTQCRNVPVRKM